MTKEPTDHDLKAILGPSLRVSTRLQAGPKWLLNEAEWDVGVLPGVVYFEADLPACGAAAKVDVEVLDHDTVTAHITCGAEVASKVLALLYSGGTEAAPAA